MTTQFSFFTLDGSHGAPARLAVAAAEEAEVLRAVSDAAQRGIVTPVLFGVEAAIRETAATEGIPIEGMDIRGVAGAEEAAGAAVRSVAEGDTAMLMKGLVDTSVLLRAVLNRDHGLRSGGVLSHLAIFEIEGFPRPLGITDAAMNIAPDLETKGEILRNAVSFFHDIGYAEPRVAILAAKEKASEKMPATVDAAALRDAAAAGSFPGCVVDGPFALDNAVSLEAARTKGIDSPVAGAADILLVPRIESGNILYKALAFLARSRHAGVIVGAAAPIVLTSRADSHAAKLDSIALAAFATRSRG